MLCPHCKANAIPFRSVWIKSAFGKYKCPQCGGMSRVRTSLPLAFLSGCLGVLATAIGIYFSTWPLFFTSLLVGLAIDALIDAHARTLVPIAVGNEIGSA